MAVESQLHSDLQVREYFNVELDECCGIQDKPQLAIFVWSVLNTCAIKDELLGLDVKKTMMAALAAFVASLSFWMP